MIKSVVQFAAYIQNVCLSRYYLPFILLKAVVVGVKNLDRRVSSNWYHAQNAAVFLLFQWIVIELHSVVLYILLVHSRNFFLPFS